MHRIQTKFLFLLVLISLILASCSAKDTDFAGEEFHITQISDYSLAHKLSFDLNKPRGLVLLQDKLYIVDSGNHRIAKVENIQSDNPVVSYFGKIGSLSGELLNPQGIAVDGEKYLYVADAGNSRVQVFNLDGKFIKEYPIKLSENPSTFLQDIELLENNQLVISLNSVQNKFANLYILDLETGKVSVIKGKITGFLTNNYNGDIYALSRLELFSTKEEDGGKSGRHAIFKLEQDKIAEVGLLPKIYTPNDGIIIDNQLFTISRTYLSIDKFSLTGEHLGTVYRPEDINKSGKEPSYEFTYLAGDLRICTFLIPKII